MHDRRAFVAAWTKHLSAFVLVLFLPIYFTHTGLRTDAGMLNTASQWTWFAIMLAGATAGKLGVCYIAARASRLTNTEAWSVGFMMNTRGLMELVVLNIGYDLGVIPREVFTMLVLVAIISTIVTAPALQRLLPRMDHVVTARKDI
jgi:Kef-type K+ transport system membrane component KefB